MYTRIYENDSKLHFMLIVNCYQLLKPLLLWAEIVKLEYLGKIQIKD